MITSMCDIFCVTNRLLCKDDFLIQIEKIAKEKPAGIILREKDLEETEYKNLASEVMTLCKRYHVSCILHSFVHVAIALQCEDIHLPLPILLQLSDQDKGRFSRIGASCHSLEEALTAERHGCTYITAGHVFDTDCKKNFPGRGLGFLKKICESVSIPVYAIGGIRADNITEIRKNGAAGVCIMSDMMMCNDVKKYLSAFKEK